MNENKNAITALVIGIFIGCLVTGIAGYAVLSDAQAKSSAIIGQLRQSEQSAITELGRLADSIGQLKSTGSAIKDNAQRSSILIDGIRKTISLFPEN